MRWTLPQRHLLHRFGRGLHLQLHRLLGGRLLTLGGALVGRSRRTRPLTRTWTRGSLLAVRNVGLFSSLDLGVGLAVDRLEERSGDGHPSGEGEAWVDLESWERHWRRNHVG